ncbi:helix-turn-helix transcriptional regulator [Algoriphagus aquimarinus]|uniref:helix-turn-helix domain-containing protein n=1 Tax=Algoriphagus aquimarinus TaxID=237018 RepID=UPI0030DC1F7D|tara:strand:- start:1586 stop:2023 length:438 start_codon:yes stop_codon:yes gene_type:complete
MKKSLKNEFEDLLGFNSTEDEVDFKTDLLPLQFLGLVDQRMEELGMSKKVLAEKIGTSASFITQLFRGDRKPNWNILAKMSNALNLEFKVMTEDILQEKVKEEITDYHRRWSHTQQYLSLKNRKLDPQLVMAVEPSSEDDYAMAG